MRGDEARKAYDNILALKELEKFLRNPRSGITEDEAQAIIRLFRHVILHEEITQQEREKWMNLGWLTYQNQKPKLLLNPDCLAAEICLMALTWRGTVQKIKPIKRRRKRKGG